MSQSNEHLQALFSAVGKGEVNEVEQILSTTEVDVDGMPQDEKRNLFIPKGFTSLHAVCMGNTPNWLKIAKTLLKHKANPNARTLDSQQTPIFFAVYHGATDLIQLLIEHGADPHLKDNNDTTLLHAAAQTGNTETIKFLLDEVKLDMNQVDKRGWLPYHTALSYGQTGAVLTFLNHGQDVNAKMRPVDSKDDQNEHPIFILVAFQQHTLARLLIEKHKLNPNPPGITISPITVATKKMDQRMVKLLSEHNVPMPNINNLSINNNNQSSSGSSSRRAAKYGNVSNNNNVAEKASASPLLQCGGCDKVEKEENEFKRCARCKKAAYCSRECQVTNWPTHKSICSE